MKIVSFLFREGSSVIFALLILGFALIKLEFLQVPHTATGMFIVSVVSLIYLGLQMAMAAFTKVGDDKPTLDMFFSMLPMFALVIIGVLAVVGATELSGFHLMGLLIAGGVVSMDVVLNTQVVFKINRLATDFVQMR